MYRKFDMLGLDHLEDSHLIPYAVISQIPFSGQVAAWEKAMGDLWRGGERKEYRKLSVINYFRKLYQWSIILQQTTSMISNLRSWAPIASQFWGVKNLIPACRMPLALGVSWSGSEGVGDSYSDPKAQWGWRISFQAPLHGCWQTQKVHFQVYTCGCLQVSDPTHWVSPQASWAYSWHGSWRS